MFDVPADTTWLWVGLVLVSATMLGVALSLPTAPPDAERTASTIDSVAATDYPGSATIDLRAEAVKIGPERVSLRGAGGTAHADIQYGPVTPVPPNSRLERVLDGQSPAAVFDGSIAFAGAAERATGRPASWRENSETLRVRQVTYGEVNRVLVGA
ncbi:DUF7283 family protein [Halodesulfurarchaeum formicicum]|uniref:Uncharacterized protein n=1 Tax=Halodesulfurarchaeum formicicum TaxID=1873524 RepID=A0A1J1ADX1_9EURY|nr:hypothetical protein [Halodesulfurarchaeum formicicum]APE95979.1 hypothetical protein HSR6_1536 [Halodesulfurarchaeum formicicum]